MGSGQIIGLWYVYTGGRACVDAGKIYVYVQIQNFRMLEFSPQNSC